MLLSLFLFIWISSIFFLEDVVSSFRYDPNSFLLKFSTTSPTTRPTTTMTRPTTASRSTTRSSSFILSHHNIRINRQSIPIPKIFKRISRTISQSYQQQQQQQQQMKPKNHIFKQSKLVRWMTLNSKNRFYCYYDNNNNNNNKNCWSKVIVQQSLQTLGEESIIESPPVITTTRRLTTFVINDRNDTNKNSNNSLSTFFFVSQTSPPLERLGRTVLEAALRSPFWKYVMVPAARSKIVQTAYENQIPWNECYSWIQSLPNAPWNNRTLLHNETLLYDYFQTNLLLLFQPKQQYNRTKTTTTTIANTNFDIPEWYRFASYHAYETGHLSWNAALESELASAAIGARNIPTAKRYGEQAFRTQFSLALEAAGCALSVHSERSNLSKNTYHTTNSFNQTCHTNQLDTVALGSSIILDIGCATGISTRWIANRYPQYQGLIVGIDLSPYNIAVARQLQQLAPLQERQNLPPHFKHSNNDGGHWVNHIHQDNRIHYYWHDATNLDKFVGMNVDCINFQFVAHEVPAINVTCRIIGEAAKVLKRPTGQLWFCEMDYEASPAQRRQRSNPFLFALIRSTEPFLDDYADHFNPQIVNALQKNFRNITIVPATGRHFAIVATDPISYSDTNSTEQQPSIISNWKDMRFDSNGTYRLADTHLQVWENKQS